MTPPSTSTSEVISLLGIQYGRQSNGHRHQVCQPGRGGGVVIGNFMARIPQKRGMLFDPLQEKDPEIGYTYREKLRTSAKELNILHAYQNACQKCTLAGVWGGEGRGHLWR